ATLRLGSRGLAHALRLGRVQLTIAVAVEALQQTGEVALPLPHHRPLGQGQVEVLHPAPGHEVSDGIERLSGMQTLLGVTVLAGGKQHAEQPAVTAHAARMTLAAAPDLAGTGPYLGALGVDQTLAGRILETQRDLAGAALHHPPAAALAVVVVLLDLVAPPQAGQPAQRRLDLATVQSMQNAIQLDIALGRR